MDRIRTIFIRGLITLLPIAVTIYVVYAGVLIFENFLGGLIKVIIPEDQYIPGLGFALTLSLIFMFGLMLNNLILQTLLRKVEEKLKSIPLIKAVYSPLRDLINLFSNSSGKGLKSVVLVRLKIHLFCRVFLSKRHIWYICCLRHIKILRGY